MDSRARRNLGQLNNELQDVQKIMVQNIDDVLQRGLAISGTWLEMSRLQVANTNVIRLFSHRTGQQGF